MQTRTRKKEPARVALIRVGIDQAFGGWNAPVDPVTGEFIYVPIPESEPFGKGLATPYSEVFPALSHFSSLHPEAKQMHVALPEALANQGMHLDPDFESLTYGDNGIRRGRGIAQFEPGDALVFYAGLRPVSPCEHRLLYAIIGFYRIASVEPAGVVTQARRSENAHTRRRSPTPTDIVVHAASGESGRLRLCLPIGELRDGAYRVRRDLLEQWGGLSCKDGFIQRSAVPPMINKPDRFMRWLERQNPELVATNNPIPQHRGRGALGDGRVIVVMLRQPSSAQDCRTDPLYEFGSFGLTDCHNRNLLLDESATGARLAFVQGGRGEVRLVMVTPPVKVVDHGRRREAQWEGQMPLRFSEAPILINNAGQSAVQGFLKFLEGSSCRTPTLAFSSAFRSRKKPLDTALAAELLCVWDKFQVSEPCLWAQHCGQSLWREPRSLDRHRQSTYERKLAEAKGGIERTACCRPSSGSDCRR